VCHHRSYGLLKDGKILLLAKHGLGGGVADAGDGAGVGAMAGNGGGGGGGGIDSIRTPLDGSGYGAKRGSSTLLL
jgi:hypothetical protein